MAYTKTEWVSGETPLSADNMNHIENGIADLASNVNALLVTTWETFTQASVSANATKNFTKTISKAGYTPIGIIGYYTGSTAIVPYHFRLDSSTSVSTLVRNITSSAVNTKPEIGILWMKNAS